MQNDFYKESQRGCKLYYSVKRETTFITQVVFHCKLLNCNQTSTTTAEFRLLKLSPHFPSSKYRKVETKLDFIEKGDFYFLNHFSTSNGTKKKGKVPYL